MTTSPDRAHVLVVDDEVLTALALQRLLGRKGFRVSVAHDGRQALELHGHDRADAVVTDFRMPHMNGADLIAALRSRAPGIPVVMISGFAPDTSGLHPDPPVRLLHKPVDPEAVLDALAEWFPSR